jgi:hypothetical protein
MKKTAHDIAASLIINLLKAFLIRVPYARIYNEMMSRKGGHFSPDHIGFRTLNTHTGEQPEGIQSIRHIFDCLGYRPAAKYTFKKKKLNAVYLEPEIEGLPKIFISQLEVSQLPGWVQDLLPAALSDTPYLLSDRGLELLGMLNQDDQLTSEAAEILENELARYFHRPWKPPLKDTILRINDVSHYAAWVLLHGNAPSHFAALVNRQNIDAWPDLKSTCKALKKAGLPMKEEEEGEQNSPLQQSATFAVKEDVKVKGSNGMEEIPWTYGYLELVQRGWVEENGGRKLFQGFIESQERAFYNMTRTLDN